MTEHKKFRKKSRALYRFLIVVCAATLIASIVALYFGGPTEEIDLLETDTDEAITETGIDVKTGFIKDEGMQTVINNCTSCHSAELVTQNKMTKEGWLATIRWMQESQNLWDLGANEETILNYLAKNYAPEDKGRRAPLANIEWYVLKD